MATERLLRLEAGALRLELNPKAGGSIRALALKLADAEHAILRAAPPSNDVLDAASFPLVPYVNRIRGGRFTFRGREVTLAPNMAGDPSPLHGQGWLAPWRVDSADASAAVLSFDHPAGEWPWTYRAEQRFEL